MFRSFFLDRRWWHWSILGTIIILSSNWVIVQIDVRINDWFGEFYDFIQQALAEPGATTIGEFFGYLVTFGQFAAAAILIQTVLGFFVNHYVFRWRTAMNDYYMTAWPRIRHVEGAAQRVQEDCMIFARIVQGLGVAFIDSIMTLVAFMPVLWGLSGHVQELPWIGKVDQALVFVAIISAAGGTVILALAGIKLPGLEFRNQLVEAAYRKELVYGEDDSHRAAPPSVRELFGNVRKNYFRLYLHYFYFGFARACYLQTSVLVPYVALGPTIIGGMITLGVLQQIIRAFNRVEGSFQFLVFSWGTIVELISVYKRLRAFEQEMRRTAPPSPSPAYATG